MSTNPQIHLNGPNHTYTHTKTFIDTYTYLVVVISYHKHYVGIFNDREHLNMYFRSTLFHNETLYNQPRTNLIFRQTS